MKDTIQVAHINLMKVEAGGIIYPGQKIVVPEKEASFYAMGQDQVFTIKKEGNVFEVISKDAKHEAPMAAKGHTSIRLDEAVIYLGAV